MNPYSSPYTKSRIAVELSTCAIVMMKGNGFMAPQTRRVNRYCAAVALARGALRAIYGS